MKAWKMAEKQVACLLGGIRRVRVGYAESVEDVSHDKYAIEVKYGKQIPKWIREIKVPVILNDIFYIFPMPSLVSFGRAETINRKGIKFLIDGLNQARSYNPTKRPLLVMKPPRFRGVVGCMYILDYLDAPITRTTGSERYSVQVESPEKTPDIDRDVYSAS
jgi:hypothetical protein